MVAREAGKRIECLECQGLMGCTWCGEQGKWQHLLSRTVLLGARLFSVLGVRALLDAVVGICLVGMRSSSQEGSEEALGLPFPDLTRIKEGLPKKAPRAESRAGVGGSRRSVGQHPEGAGARRAWREVCV